ncbi:MAG: FHA domain-containing protein [Planctomycetia bacterium]|nr:FHA domain-containing protein [Planctomycetia bacterium]
MGDPRFNSIHLDPVRREDYRRARDVVLKARGQETMFGEVHRSASEEPNPTMIRAGYDGKPETDRPLDYWISNREYVFPLKVGVNTMGRSSDNDIHVEDLFVSRRHCAILVHHDGSCILHDTASKNGTYLNGLRINAPTPLKPGDEIRICNQRYLFNTRGDNPQVGTGTRTIG